MHDKDAHAQFATDLLRADHATVRALFDEYQNAMDEDAAARQVIAQEICMQLEIHHRVELELFYPAV
ncbi:MAG TPA: hemerythrin domain-containing protein, partial [Burkholderiales bacterium]